MFYQGGGVPPYVNYIGISSLRTITHTQEPMTLVMDSWHTSIQNGCGSSVRTFAIVIQRVARDDCSF